MKLAKVLKKMKELEKKEKGESSLPSMPSPKAKMSEKKGFHAKANSEEGAVLHRSIGNRKAKAG